MRAVDGYADEHHEPELEEQENQEDGIDGEPVLRFQTREAPSSGVDLGGIRAVADERPVSPKGQEAHKGGSARENRKGNSGRRHS